MRSEVSVPWLITDQLYSFARLTQSLLLLSIIILHSCLFQAQLFQVSGCSSFLDFSATQHWVCHLPNYESFNVFRFIPKSCVTCWLAPHIRCGLLKLRLPLALDFHSSSGRRVFHRCVWSHSLPCGPVPPVVAILDLCMNLSLICNLNRERDT